MSAVPLRMPLSVPLVGLVSIDVNEANALLEEWSHYLGPTKRPFPPTQAFALDMEGEPIAVATSDGGTWSRKRRHNEAANGPKTLWLWRFT